MPFNCVRNFTAPLQARRYTEVTLSSKGVCMEEREQKTVIVEGNRRPSYGWLIALIIVIVLLILFFAFGGTRLFSGSKTQTINVTTPQPSTSTQP